MNRTHVLASLALVSAYSPGDGWTPGTITASGEPVRAGITLACPEHLAFGTRVWLHTVGVRVCEDRGSAITGEHRFDLAMSSPAEARAFGMQRLRYAVLPAGQPDPQRMLRVFRGKAPAWNCSYAPYRGGAYSAKHCLQGVWGPGWTVYVGTQRVRAFSLDQSRDLAHMNEGAESAALRTPHVGETATLRGSTLTAHEVANVAFEGGTIWRVRRWCVAGAGFGKGVSGSGVYGSDGALLGVVSGGSFSYDNGPLGSPVCGGNQVMYTAEVP